MHVADQDRLRSITVACASAAEAHARASANLGGIPDEALTELLDGRATLVELITGSPEAAAAEQLRLLSQIDALLADVEEAASTTGLDALLRIQESMVRLRGCTSPQDLVERAPQELCTALGFSRAMISRVKLSIWVPEILEIRGGDAREAEEFQAFVEHNTIPLSHLMMETDLVRRRIGARVMDPESDPRTYKPIVAAARCSSYVAAPILPADRVIGFFHADRRGQGVEVSEADRESLWMFAEHFGLIYERFILVQRLETQRRRLHSALQATAEKLDQVCAEDIELARNEAPRDRPQLAMDRISRVSDLLSDREREILDLMAKGATNAQIADALVVAEGTVKSHVKRILRKLHASNRAEAVARYLRLVRQDRARI